MAPNIAADWTALATVDTVKMLFSEETRVEDGLGGAHLAQVEHSPHGDREDEQADDLPGATRRTRCRPN